MAHVNIHLAAGLAVGTAIGAVPLVRAWIAGRPVARPLALMIALTCGLAIWAIVPNLLVKAGIHIDGRRWCDVFVLHTTLDKRIRGGLMIGEVAIATTLLGQYLVIVAALIRARRKRPAP